MADANLRPAPNNPGSRAVERVRLCTTPAAERPTCVARLTRPSRKARLGRHLDAGWRVQLALFATAYVVYNLARWLFAGDLAPAQAHARWIVELERATGLAIEGSVQRALDSDVASWLLGNVYLAAQFVVVPGALIWLYRGRPHVYRDLRNTLLAAWLIAVPSFALFPVAPPRLAGVGIVDTVSQQAGGALTGRSTIFYNQLAAVPSLHVGFAVAVSVALAVALRRHWARALVLFWGPIVSLAVVATGNHFLFDIGAGLAVILLGFAAGRLAIRLRARDPRAPRPGCPHDIAPHPARVRIGRTDSAGLCG